MKLELKEPDVCMADTSYVQDSDNAVALTSQLNSNESRHNKIPSEENLSAADEVISAAAEESKSTFNIEDSKSHRQNVHYSSESSDYETDESSDSSDCDEFFDNLRKSVAPAKLPVLKTKGELLIEDLPPVEDLHITVNSTELLKIGCILHWVVAPERNEFLVIVVADGNSNPLDEDSVLFLSSNKPLGKIHDVFGSVSKPNYIVRFNKAEDIFNKGVTIGQIVYYSPSNGELTRYVLVDVLKKQKGSDASWKDNNEPPDDEIDYSDDEQEKLAKQKRRAKTRGKERNWNDGEREDVVPNKMERRDAAYNQKRPYKRPSRNMFQSPTPGPSRSSPRSYSPQSFGMAPPPPSNNFGSSGLLRNAISPQPFGLASSNSIPFLQRNVPSPQLLGPFPHSNVPSPQPFGSIPHSNVPSPQHFGSIPHSNGPSPQPF
ncbi:H/ACA ribonucleoprotein complex non-core subunit NAF1, partial [Araneus ventricosus]